MINEIETLTACEYKDTGINATKAAIQNRDFEIDPELLEQFLPMVRYVVNRLAKNLPSHVDLDDLHSIGVLGLLEALRNHNPGQAKTFPAYARTRIRGSIVDELRRMDSLPRSARSKARALEAAIRKLEQKYGRVPTDKEVRRHLGLDGRAYQRMMKQVQPVTLISLDQPVESSDDTVDLHDALPDESKELCWEQMQQEELQELIGEELGRLPERHKKIVAMYYHENMRLCDIAQVFELTEARICQIHAEALSILRKQVTQAMYN